MAARRLIVSSLVVAMGASGCLFNTNNTTTEPVFEPDLDAGVTPDAGMTPPAPMDCENERSSEFEPNNVLADADEIELTELPAMRPGVCGVLDGSNDVDYFRFELSSTASRSGDLFAYIVTTWGDDTSCAPEGFDPQLTLTSSTGREIAYSDDADDTTGNLCPIIDSTLGHMAARNLEDGVYYLRVEVSGFATGDVRGRYFLTVAAE